MAEPPTSPPYSRKIGSRCPGSQESIRHCTQGHTYWPRRQNVPPHLTNMLRALLSPMLLQTKGQKSNNLARKILGLPKGDPPSPLLFNIFIDTFLLDTNHDPFIGASSCFADDFVLLANSEAHLQDLLTSASSWSATMKITWSVPKFSSIDEKQPLTLADKPLPVKSETTYLGITMTTQVLSKTEILSHIRHASNMVSLLMSSLKTCRTSIKQRRSFLKTFVFRITDYVHYTQPIVPPVAEEATTLDRKASRFVLATSIPPLKHDRAMAVAGLLPMSTRRQFHLLSSVTKFQRAAINPYQRTGKGETKTSYPQWTVYAQKYHPTSLQLTWMPYQNGSETTVRPASLRPVLSSTNSSERLRLQTRRPSSQHCRRTFPLTFSTRPSYDTSKNSQCALPSNAR